MSIYFIKQDDRIPESLAQKSSWNPLRDNLNYSP